MGSKLTSYIIGNENFMWESVDSCRSFCDEVIICNLSMSDESLDVMMRYSKDKGKVSIVNFDTIEDVLMNIRINEWSFVSFGNEIMHDDAVHYLWDISRRHDEFDTVGVKMLYAFIREDGWRFVESSSLRMFNRKTPHFLKNKGGHIYLDENKNWNMPPLELCPKPLWKFLFNSKDDSCLCNKVSSEYLNLMPKITRRLFGRLTYSNPYI